MTPGNVHDSVAFNNIYDEVKDKFENIKSIVVDAGYITPFICKTIIDDNKRPVMPYKRPMTKKGFFKKYDYVYDEYYDVYICPAGQSLKYKTTNREGYKIYASNPNICSKCQFINQCTESKKYVKVISRHIWEEYVEEANHLRHTSYNKEIYALRSQTIERVFADIKEKYGMRFTTLRDYFAWRDCLSTN